LRVVDAGFPFRPESVTDALLVQCGEKAAIAFLATEPRDDGKWHVCGTVVFRSPAVIQIKYGHPNDEAFRGHPLYEKGLKDFSISEIEDSDWVREVAETNARVFPNTAGMFTGVRHHVFPFKESTLEVLWSEFEYEITDQGYSELGGELSEWANRY